LRQDGYREVRCAEFAAEAERDIEARGFRNFRNF
jgi:hypothetical protein